MQVYFVNNEGAGFSDDVAVDDGVTLRSFLSGRIQLSQADRYTIRVNGREVSLDTALHDGDRICVTPAKIAAG